MLSLNVPRLEDSVLQNTIETRPKAAAEWLSRLPFGSPVETAQQLIVALHTLNRRALDEDERNTLLALYRPVIARAAASLETLLVESGVPPTEQQRKAGGLLRELLTELSIGYKHVLLALDSRRFGRNPPKRVAEVTARLLAVQRDILAACYLAYSPPPDGLWLEMHQVYQLARSTGLADDAVGDAAPASLAYRQALLLALADPPHMSHAELDHTRKYLEKFAALAELSLAMVDPAHSHFEILTDRDHGPRPLSGSPMEGCLWLDTEALCGHLYDTATRLRGSETPKGVERELSLGLIKRLLKIWRAGAQRAFKRYASSDSTVQVVAGVSAIHRLLELMTQTATPEADAPDSLHIGDIGWALAAPAAVAATRWTISNESAAGLALSGAPDAQLNLKVGDALALRAAERGAVDGSPGGAEPIRASADMLPWPASGGGEAVWSLAVIRWIRMRDARQVELGVERLSPQVQPVWVRTLTGRHTANPEPALFVPGLPALKQPDRLLLPRPLYQSGMDAEVWRTLQQRHNLTFGRRLAHTPSFDLIDFTLFANESPP
jgi:hypothetical protein